MSNKSIIEYAGRIQELAKEISKVAKGIKKELKNPAGMLGREDGKINNGFKRKHEFLFLKDKEPKMY